MAIWWGSGWAAIPVTINAHYQLPPLLIAIVAKKERAIGVSFSLWICWVATPFCQPAPIPARKNVPFPVAHSS